MSYESTTLKPYMQVSNHRAIGEGWHVKVLASAFNDGNTNALPGAQICFNNAETVSTSTAAAPISQSMITLDAGGSAVGVVNAASKTATSSSTQGVETWLIHWMSPNTTNEKIVLEVPESSATEGTHTSTIT